MPVTNRIAELATEVKEWRQHLHTIPELSFDLPKTSTFVAEKLTEFGVDEVHTGIAKSGVVGVIKAGSSDRAIGLRADMDALPMPEMADVPYKSTHDGAMHACGHDGHTSMLLGAAKYMAETRNFDGTVYLYFQPAEENGGGANIMLEEGLFDKFRPDEVYAMHNWPNMPVGKFGVATGPVMAAPDSWKMTINGKGGHGAQPHLCVDPVIVGTQIVNALQTLVSRVTNPLESLVISTTMFNAGTAFNVIPDVAVLGGTVRTFNPEVRNGIEDKMRTVAENVAAAYGATIEFDYTYEYPATVNHDAETEYARAVCTDMVGTDNILDFEPSMGGEDFSYMLEKVPGCYIFAGNGDSRGLHHPEYIFNDELLQYGMDFFAKIVETRLPK